MSGDNEDRTPSDPNALPPLSYEDYGEYHRLLRMLDLQQHLNLSAHLYSSYLISRLTKGHIPHLSWTAWPLKNAPIPPQIMDDFPTSVPGVIDPGKIRKVKDRALQSFPLPPDPDADAPQVLLRACEEVLRRIVYRRIHNDKALDIEAVLEPEPELGGALSQAVVDTVNKYITRVPAVFRKRRLVTWQNLGIKGPAKKRLNRLFSRGLREYDDHIDETGANNPSGGDIAVGDDNESDENEPKNRSNDLGVTTNSETGDAKVSDSEVSDSEVSDTEVSDPGSEFSTDSSRAGFTGSESDTGSASDDSSANEAENDSEVNYVTSDSSNEN